MHTPTRCACVQLMLATGGQAHLERRTQVLEELGFLASIATVASGEHEGKSLGELAESEWPAVRQAAETAKAALLVHMGERVISNPAVRLRDELSCSCLSTSLWIWLENCAQTGAPPTLTSGVFRAVQATL